MQQAWYVSSHTFILSEKTHIKTCPQALDILYDWEIHQKVTARRSSYQLKVSLLHEQFVNNLLQIIVTDLFLLACLEGFASLTGSLASNAFGFESSLTSVVLLALTVAGVATPPTALRPVQKISAEWDLSITG